MSFYAIDVAGLDTYSEAGARATLSPRWRKRAASRGQKTSGATSTAEIRVDENAEASTRTNWKQPLKELSENTGGFAVLDTNDYRKPMERLVADLGGSYEVTYAPSVAAWDEASAAPTSR